MIRLRELREKNGKTLEEVAKALGLRNQYVSNYELEKRRPDYETLKKFSDYYGVTIDYILGRDNVSEEDQDFLRMNNKAKKQGITAKDLESMIDFLTQAKERDKTNK